MLSQIFQFQNSLTRTTIIKMGLRIAIIIIAVTLVSYWHVMSNFETQTVEQLEKYIVERGHRESKLFQLAEDNLTAFQQDFLVRVKNPDEEYLQKRFDQLFQKLDDGSTRMRPEYYHGIKQTDGRIVQGMTGFIHTRASITTELRRRFAIGSDMLINYGPAWFHRFDNLYFAMPDTTIIVYWPEVDWYLGVPADLDRTEEEWAYTSDYEHNPNRKPIWTGLYYDAPSKGWMVSCLHPIDFGDQNYAFVGSDILLNQLFERTINDHLEGAHNMIFRKDGRLIVHPNYVVEIQEKNGFFEIPKHGDRFLRNVFQLIKDQSNEMTVIENTKNDEYLAVTKIKGPDWYFVTVYPKSLLEGLAFDTARFILILGLLSLLIEVVMLFSVLRKQVAQPLQEFLGATQQIATGNFNVEATQHLPLNRRDEIGDLAQSFNSMAVQLKTSFNTLDAKVIERTAQLDEKIEELTKTRQELVQSEKMAALGQLVAGIAHEVNTPLGAIRSSAETLTNGLKQTLARFPKLFEVLTKAQQETFFALLDRSLQNQVILTVKEKRAAKKTLTAELKQCGIANPRAFSETFISLGLYAQADQYLPLLQDANSDFVFETAYQLSTLTRSTDNITTAVERASKVIFALKTFARHDLRSEKTAASLQESLETVLTLYHNQIKQGIELIKEYDEIAPISCYPDELNQVWTNLLHNALQAMDYKGTLTVVISQQDHYAVVAITDSGQGISPEIKEQIFTPFFTTKAAGEGSGLGLDIVKKIIEKHDGKIEVDSEVGFGTTFSILLPMEQNF
jgi:signal transduction histidine kinase